MCQTKRLTWLHFKCRFTRNILTYLFFPLLTCVWIYTGCLVAGCKHVRRQVVQRVFFTFVSLLSFLRHMTIDCLHAAIRSRVLYYVYDFFTKCAWLRSNLMLNKAAIQNRRFWARLVINKHQYASFQCTTSLVNQKS